MAFLQPHTANLTPHAACVAPEPNQRPSQQVKSITAKRMISGLVLKYLNGECFVICGFYKYTLLASTEFNLTVPPQVMLSWCCGMVESFGHWCSVKTFKRSTDRRSASDVARYVQLLQFANALVPINRANSANRAIRFQD